MIENISKPTLETRSLTGDGAVTAGLVADGRGALILAELSAADPVRRAALAERYVAAGLRRDAVNELLTVAETRAAPVVVRTGTAPERETRSDSDYDYLIY